MCGGVKVFPRSMCIRFAGSLLRDELDVPALKVGTEAVALAGDVPQYETLGHLSNSHTTTNTRCS